MITHDKEDAFSMSETIAFLFEGKVALIDKPRNLSSKTGINDIDEYLGEITILDNGRIIFSDRIIEI